MRKPFKHMTMERRKEIERLHRAGVCPQEIADRLGVHQASVYRELKRGEIAGRYCAEEGQKHYEDNWAQKGREPIIISNQELMAYIQNKILNEKWSPKRISDQLRMEEQGKFPYVSARTIYRAIEKGYVPGVTEEDIQNNCATVRKDGRLYIPAWFLEKYQLSPGQKFEISMENGTILLRETED